MTDEDVEWFARGGFAEPWLEVVEEFGDGVDTGEVDEFGLSEEARDASEVELVANGAEAEVAGEFDEGVDSGFDGGFDGGLGGDADF